MFLEFIGRYPQFDRLPPSSLSFALKSVWKNAKRSLVIFSRLNILKSTAKSPAVDLLRLWTFCLTPKRYDGYPCPFYVEVPPPLQDATQEPSSVNSRSRAQSRSHTHLFCALPHGFPRKRETDGFSDEYNTS